MRVSFYNFAGMEVERAIRTRRTVKAFASEPVDRELLERLLELARWAPNHHLTNPWRFRVLGPRSLAALKVAAAELALAEAPPGANPDQLAEAAAAKLDRAPTLVVCSVEQSGDPERDEEDAYAGACAAYIVLLAAHANGLAGYWRTPGVLRSDPGRAAVGLRAGERFIGLLHLGHARQQLPDVAVPERDEPERYVEFLD
jgi:nitroreductase